MRQFYLGILFGLWVPLFPVRADAPAADQLEFFEKKIRPVLAEHCYSCHSADAKKLRGGLKLDTRESALKGGDTGPSLIPGDPDKSLLIQAVRWKSDDLKMPPKQKLSDQQIADLETWIRMGAPDPRTDGGATNTISKIDVEKARQWWAFRPLSRPSVSNIQNPKSEISNLKSEISNPVDSFILARLAEKSLSPAPAADKRTLIRRATFDLIGMPPTPHEVADFLADQSPDAFERVVNRLLASPRYGERWGRHWLDLVRYTDSFDARGLGGAGDCAEAWRYRDWVVQSFNNDLPYDQFVKMQLAGDLLMGSGLNSLNSEPRKGAELATARDPLNAFDPNGIIATSVLAIGNWGNGDSDKEKQLTDIVDDQVDLVGRAFLGLTIACARCHDHKFDPISTEDYYGLAGIFFSTHINPNPGPKTAGSELLRIPLISPQEQQQRERDKTKIAELEKQSQQLIDKALATLSNELSTKLSDYLSAARTSAADDLNPILLGRFKELFTQRDQKLFTKSRTNIHNLEGLFAWTNDSGDTPSLTINTRSEEAHFITIRLPPHSVAVHPSPKAGVAVAFNSPFTGKATVTGLVADADPNCGDGIAWKIQHNLADRASGQIASGGSAKLAPISLDLREDDSIQLLIVPKNDYSCDTTTIDLTIANAESNQSWTLSNDLMANPIRGNPLGPWRFIDAAGPADMPPLVATLISAKSEEDFAHAKTALLADQKTRDALLAPGGFFFKPIRANSPILSTDDQSALAAIQSQISNLRSQISKPVAQSHGIREGGLPESPHAGKPHDVKVHIRGRYDRLGNLVSRRFPEVLTDAQPPIKSSESGRRELADWIASPNNPLTARVMVNRIWLHHFGEGLVRTPNNFGHLGTPPNHPELLDYLASEFINSGWSIKRMHRLIMLSATYQQSSNPQANDPDNLFFSRQNRRRMEAELLRDALLSASGKLDLSAGGPAYRDLSTPRRTLYLMTIRSDRANYRMLFDAADPNGVAEKRIDSTVAPQALFMLNHPFALEQTTALAQRLQREGDVTPQERIGWLYNLLYARPPQPREIEIGLKLVKTEGTGNEQLTWERYCQVLLCSNEFIYID